MTFFGLSFIPYFLKLSVGYGISGCSLPFYDDIHHTHSSQHDEYHHRNVDSTGVYFRMNRASSN